MAIWREHDDLKTRITAARQHAGLNKSELARAMEIEPEAVRLWEIGRTSPRRARMRKLAQITGVDFTWLISGTGHMKHSPRTDQLVDGYDKPEDIPGYANTTEAGPIVARVPVISSVQAGAWAEIVDNFEPGDADEWIPVYRKVGKHAFALGLL